VKRPVLFVFDLDGTLVDSRTDLANAANAALTQLGLSPLPKETIISYVGDGIDALIRRCLTSRHESRLPEAKTLFAEHYARHFLDNTTLLPGIHKALEELKDKSLLAVLTNKSEPYAVKILEGLGIAPLFAEIAGEKNGRVPKPDPTVLKSIMERLGAPESQTLMVGDGKNDILVAKAVGCGSCLVARSGEMEQNLVVYEPDIIIHSMEELPELFEET
jgi:2-phosphoglycolate phosphatase